MYSNMKFVDLSEFCRLCLMPLKGSHIDCALDENHEFKDTIKMVYNIDIDVVDEFSTKVCLMCCNIMMEHTIHYHRAVEAQKSLTRVQRIKNKLRKFGKKKSEKKCEKQPLPVDLPIIDVEMIEVEQISSKVIPMDDYEMDEFDGSETTDSGVNSPTNIEINAPLFFANLSSFNQNQLPTNHQNNFSGWNNSFFGAVDGNIAEESENSGATLKRPLDQSNINNHVKQSSSFFQMAKTFCGNIMKKHKTNVELGLDEITNRMASLRFTT